MDEVIPGLFAGIVSTFICNPLDIIRLNYQIGKKIDISSLKLTKGLTIGLLTIPTFWTIYFPMYSNLKEKTYKPTAAYLACCTASAMTAPLWYIKQMIQTDKPFDFKKTKLKTFYTGTGATFIINGSFTIQIPLYEYLRDKIENLTTPKVFLITSFSKILASSVFYPLDTLRSIRRNFPNYSYLTSIKNLSILQYYRGYHIYLIRSLPYYCSIFCTYEFFKKVLKKKTNIY
jgi:hypothetical protein